MARFCSDFWRKGSKELDESEDFLEEIGQEIHVLRSMLYMW